MKNSELNIGFLTTTRVNIRAVTTKQTLGWQISKYNFPEIWSQTKGAGIKVAILDTAIDLRHSDLLIKGGYDFITNKGIENYKNIYPVQGHGTHVAGIIAARNNTIGVVGVAPESDLYSCVVLNNEGSGTYGNIIKAIDWCISSKMDVINMSFGGGLDTSIFYSAIRRAYDANIAMVCAGGNSGWSGYLDFPATYNETISVAAINNQMKRAYFSSVGSNIDVAAPGSDILSCTPKNTYSIYSGTSMAAPFVTGLIALLISKHRKMGGNTAVNNVEDIRNHLIKVATDVDYKGQDSLTGYGLVNPNSSMNFDESKTTIKYSDLINGIQVRIDNKQLSVPQNSIITAKFKKNSILEAIKSK